jgi:hypothetical protein
MSGSEREQQLEAAFREAIALLERTRWTMWNKAPQLESDTVNGLRRFRALVGETQ